MARPPAVEPAPPEWGAAASGPRSTSALHLLAELVQTLLIAVFLFFVVDRTTARIRVDGNSMEPSLHDGDLVVVNRLAYWLGEPARGDIIVFYFPYDPEKRYIKRLIGLPGDQITVRGGQLYINGQGLHERYTTGESSRDGNWVVGPNEVFVLGDNRANSSDSSDWGTVPMSEVIGKAFLVYWPPWDLRVIPHYDLVGEAAQ
ncbi:MAG: signal peptidase I [Chloroflexota bacterium]